MCTAQRVTIENMIDFVTNGVAIPESATVNSSSVSNPQPPLRRSTKAPKNAKGSFPEKPVVLQPGERPINQTSAKEFFIAKSKSSTIQRVHTNPRQLTSSKSPEHNGNDDPREGLGFTNRKHVPNRHLQDDNTNCGRTKGKNAIQRVEKESRKQSSPLIPFGRNYRGDPTFRKPQPQQVKPYEAGPVPFNESTISNWIYPVNPKHPKRDYQIEMSETALFQNTLISLPTGLGKTMIAAVVLYNFHRWFPTGKIIFCCPTQPLVTQQVEACHKIVTISERETATLTGKTTAEVRERLWMERRLFFCTPQTVQNDILNPGMNVPASKVVCVILDEVHRATGDHAYVKVIELLEQAGAKFRVIGLSATPGSTQKAVQSVVDVLKVSGIECRSDDDENIKKYIHDRQHEMCIVEHGTLSLSFRDQVLNIMRPYLKGLQENNILNGANSGVALAPFAVLKAKKAYEKENNTNTPGYHSVMSKFVILQMLAQWRVAVQDYSVGQLREKVISFIESNKWGYTGALTKDPNFQELENKLRKGTECSQGLTQKEILLSRNPKMMKLQEILQEHFKREKALLGSIRGVRQERCSKDETETPPSTRAIVFSQLRASVAEIVKALKAYQPDIRPSVFVGQSNGNRGMEKAVGTGIKGQVSGDASRTEVAKHLKGMKQSEQQKVLKNFRDGIYNVLVCTSIGEEGLDIGEVDLIVNYDCLNSPIRMIQRVGRTGRARDGRVVCILTKEEQAKFNISKHREKTLLRILKDKRKMHFHPIEPLFPSDRPKPVCCEKQLRTDEVSFNWDLVGGNNDHGKGKGKRQRRGEAQPDKRIKLDDEWRLTGQEEVLRKEVLGETIAKCCTNDPSSAHGFPQSLRSLFLKARTMSYAAQCPKDLSRYKLGRSLIISRTIQENHGDRHDPSSAAAPRSFLRSDEASQSVFAVNEGASIACPLRSLRKKVNVTLKQPALKTSLGVPLKASAEEKRLAMASNICAVPVCGGRQQGPPDPPTAPASPNELLHVSRDLRTTSSGGLSHSASTKPSGGARSPHMKCTTNKQLTTGQRAWLANGSVTSISALVSDKDPQKPPLGTEGSSIVASSLINSASSLMISNSIANMDAMEIAPSMGADFPKKKVLQTEEAGLDTESSAGLTAQSDHVAAAAVASSPRVEKGKTRAESCFPAPPDSGSSSDESLEREQAVEFRLPTPESSSDEDDRIDHDKGESNIVAHAKLPPIHRGEPRDDPMQCSPEESIVINNWPLMETKVNARKGLGSHKHQAFGSNQNSPQVWRLPTQSSSSSEGESESAPPLKELFQEIQPVSLALSRGDGSQGTEKEEEKDGDMPLVAACKTTIENEDNPVFAEEKSALSATSDGLSYDADSEVVAHAGRHGTGKRKCDPFITQQSPGAVAFNPSVTSNSLVDTPIQSQMPDGLVDTFPEDPDSEMLCPRKGKGRKQVDPFLTQHSPPVAGNGANLNPAMYNSLVDTPIQLIVTTSGGQADGELADAPQDHPRKHEECIDDVACALCLSTESPDDDPIVYCDGYVGKGASCNLAVHVSCYSIDAKVLEEVDELWRCDPCSWQHQIFLTKEVPSQCPLRFVKCHACQNLRGPLKRVAKQSWSHPHCGQWSTGKGKDCGICNRKGTLSCGKEGCAAAVHSHCTIDAMSLGRSDWTLLLFSEWKDGNQTKSIIFCDELATEANSMAEKGCVGKQESNGRLLTVIPPCRFSPEGSEAAEKRHTKKLKPVKAIKTAAGRKREVEVDSSQLEMEKVRRKRKRARLERREKARQFIDEEADIGSDEEGDEAEAWELAVLEEEDESMTSFINDSSQLGFVQDQLACIEMSGGGRFSLSSCSANEDALHWRLDQQRAIDEQYATPFLNRKMQRDSLTPVSAPDSERGLGKLHFVRSVLEHHRHGGDAHAIEGCYQELQEKARKENQKN